MGKKITLDQVKKSNIKEGNKGELNEHQKGRRWSEHQVNIRK